MNLSTIKYIKKKFQTHLLQVLSCFVSNHAPDTDAPIKWTLDTDVHSSTTLLLIYLCFNCQYKCKDGERNVKTLHLVLRHYSFVISIFCVVESK